MSSSAIRYATIAMRGVRHFSRSRTLGLQLRKFVPKTYSPIGRWGNVRKFTTQASQLPFRAKSHFPPKNIGTVISTIATGGITISVFGGFFSSEDPRLEELKTIATLFEATLPAKGADEAAYLVKCEQICFELLFTALLKKQYSKLLEIKDLLDTFTDSLGRTLLLAAAEDGDSSMVKWLLDERIALNKRDPEGNTPLHIACANNQDHLLDILSPYYANTKNHRGENAIHVAIRNGHAELIKPLIRGTVDAQTSCQVRVNEEEYALNPLALSVATGSCECLEMLIEEAGFPNDALASLTEGIGNLLHVAYFFGQPQMVRHLFEHHSEDAKKMVNQKAGKDLCDPLSLAASFGYAYELKYLAERGVVRSQVDSEGRTALLRAAKEGHIETVEMLIFLGFDATAFDRENKCARNYFQSGSTEHTRLIVAQTKFAKGIKSPPNFLQEPPENLVFQGGGPKGIVYVGVIKALEEIDLLRNLKRVAGTSAGAITATLVALGYSVTRMEKILLDFDLRSLLDASDEKLLESVLSGAKGKEAGPVVRYALGQSVSDLLHLKSPFALFQRLSQMEGICEGELFLSWIESMIYEQTGIHNCTFGEFRKEREKGRNFKELHVFATNLDTRRVDCFSTSGDTDNVVMADAIRASMSIPGLFKPHQIRYKNSPDEQPFTRSTDGRHCDGGLIRNFALDEFDRKAYTKKGPVSKKEWDVTYPNRRTLGLCPVQIGEAIETDQPIKGPKDLLLAIAGVYLNAEAILQTNKAEYHDRVIEIPVTIGLLDFDLKPNEKVEMVQDGYDTTHASPFFNAGKENAA